MHLPLVYDTPFVTVDELDRILDGDDMLMPLAVNFVDHGSERGGFARTGGAGDQNQPGGSGAEFLHHLWQP